MYIYIHRLPGSPNTKLCLFVVGNPLYESSQRLLFVVWSWTSRGRCIMAAFLATSAMNLHPESENSLSLKLYPSLVLSRAAGVRKRRQLLGRPKITSRKFRSYHRHKDWTNLMFDIPARFRKELIKFYNKSWPSKSKNKNWFFQQTKMALQKIRLITSKLLCFSKPVFAV